MTQTATSTPSIAWQGAITGLYGDVLQGWALDASQPDLRLVVEVCVDGACVAMARADQFQPSAEHGDQFHGFAVQLRDTWLAGARHISVRIANTAHYLDNPVQLPSAAPKAPAPVASQVWHTGGLRLAGWAWDPQAPGRHVTITVREGDRQLERTLCNQRHPALAQRSSDDHGFELELPWALADGKPHLLHVETDAGVPLSGSPFTLCCWPEGMEGLLREYRADSTRSPLLTLAEQLAKEQAMRLPKSAGFQHYAHWHAAFQQPPALAPDTPRRTLGVLLISHGDAAQERISQRSVEAQRLGHVHTAIATADNILPGLRQLLDLGCDAVLPLHAGDHLPVHAMDQLQRGLEAGAAWCYGDCDRDGPHGERSLPWFKPSWDLDLFLGADIFSPGALLGRAIIDDALRLLTPESGLQWLDWHYLMAAIALISESEQRRVAHLPFILYHRSHASIASPEHVRPSMDRHQAVAWLSQCLAPGATPLPHPAHPGLLRVHWPLPEKLPRISLIVPTRDQVGLLRTCIEGLVGQTDYPHLEVIVVDNQSSEPQTLAYLAELRGRGVKVLDHPYPFNYATINNRAVEHATGEIIGLVNNDIEIIDAGWLKEMLSQLLRPGVGAVGAKLLWPNRMVQHGGVVVGINGLAAHSGNTLEDRDPGYLASNQLTRQQSAVTAACLLMRKSLFTGLAGLDDIAFPVAFNDVDLCLRIRKHGYKLIWSAFARLVHAESASRGKDISSDKRSRALREQQWFMERWFSNGEQDMHYHPALSADYLSGPYGGLALPPRSTAIRWSAS